jgi:hypothetical protein
MEFALIKVVTGPEGQPVVVGHHVATPEAPVVSENADGDTEPDATVAAEGPSGLIDTGANPT